MLSSAESGPRVILLPRPAIGGRATVGVQAQSQALRLDPKIQIRETVAAVLVEISRGIVAREAMAPREQHRIGEIRVEVREVKRNPKPGFCVAYSLAMTAEATTMGSIKCGHLEGIFGPEELQDIVEERSLADQLHRQGIVVSNFRQSGDCVVSFLVKVRGSNYWKK